MTLMTKTYLVPRAREVDFLHKAVESVITTKQPLALFIEGDFGTGKTILTEQFLNEISNNKDVLIGRSICSMETGDNGLVPFSNLLVDLSQNGIKKGIILGDIIRFVAEVAPAWLDLFTSGLASATKKTISALSKTNEQDRALIGRKSYTQDSIFTQFVDALQRLSEKQLTVIFIDDIHWADITSLQLIYHLSRNIKGKQLLFLYTFRPVEANEANANAKLFREITANMLEHDLARILDLSKFPGINVATYIKNRYPANKFPLSLINRIQESTEGHPLFVDHLFSYWQDIGKINEVVIADQKIWSIKSSEISTLQIPKSLGKLLEARIRLLEDGLREDLILASIEGNNFTAQVISKQKSLENPLNLYQELKNLERRFYLIQSKETRVVGSTTYDIYQFSHRFIREYIYAEEITDPEKRILHRRVGEILESLYPDASSIASLLANHFHKANEGFKAASYALMAARMEQSRQSSYESKFWCETGLQWLSKIYGDTDRQVVKLHAELLEQLAYIHYCLGKFGDAEPKYRQALEEIRKLQNLDSGADTAVWIAQTILMLADTCDYEGKDKECIDLLKSGRELLINAGIPFGDVQFMIEVFLCYMYGEAGVEPIAQIAEINRLIEFAGSLKLTPRLEYEMGYAYILLGVLSSDLGNYRKSISCFQKVVEIAEKSKHRWLLNLALVNLADDYQRRGEYSNGIEFASRALRLSLQIGDVDTAAVAHTVKGDIYLHQERFVEALQEFERAISFSHEINAGHYLSHMYAGKAICLIENSQLSEALEYAEKSLAMAEQADDTFEMIYSLDCLAAVKVEYGEIDDAVEVLKRAISLHVPDEQPPYGGHAQVHLAELYFKQRATEDALVLLANAQRVYERLGLMEFSAQTQKLFAQYSSS